MNIFKSYYKKMNNSDELFRHNGIQYYGESNGGYQQVLTRAILISRYKFDSDIILYVSDKENDKCICVTIPTHSGVCNAGHITYAIYKTFYVIEYYYGNNSYEYNIKYHNIMDCVLLNCICVCNNRYVIESILNGEHILNTILNERNIVFNQMKDICMNLQSRLDKKEIEYEDLYDENRKLKEEIKQFKINYKTFENEIKRLNTIIDSM